MASSRPTRQVASNVPQETTKHSSVDSLGFLQSDTDPEAEEVKLIQVPVKGRQPRGAKVQVQGVPAWGIVVSGADITIIRKELFKTVAAVSKLKKRDFKKPNKVPKTYDR